MKKNLYILFVLFPFSTLFSQTYTEIFEGGWGQAKNSTKPAFIDLDNDGLLDMVVGEYLGNLIHYEQESSNSTNFTKVADIIQELELGKSTAPTFTDLDNDSLVDMIVGTQSGNLLHYEQDAIHSNDFTFITQNFNNIYAGSRPVPIFTNLDNNGLLDLLIGVQDGTISYYEQDSTNAPTFYLITNNFCEIDVNKWCAPTITDLDGDDLWDLIIGPNSGDLFYYEQEAANSRNFRFVADSLGGTKAVNHASPVFTDLDNNGLLDMVLGDSYGFLYHYEQKAALSTDFKMVTDNLLTGIINVGSSAVPCFADLDNDGLLDMLVGSYTYFMHHYEQDSYGSNTFNLTTDSFNNIWAGIYSSPVITDLGNNDRLDLIVGSSGGKLYHYEQNAPNSYEFSEITNHFSDIDNGSYSEPAITDLDDDGLLDMIIGEMAGKLVHYEQDTEGSLTFTMLSDSMSGIYIDDWLKPSFTDLDQNGLLDMLVGHRYGTLYHYEQNTPGSNDFTLITDQFMGLTVGEHSRPVFADINRDGLDDLLVGDSDGGIHYFQRDAETGVQQKKTVDLQSASFQLLQNYPNPFNPSTCISYTLTKPGDVSLKIYNLAGQEIETLVNGFQKAGKYNITWQAKNLPSGLYFYRLKSGDYSKTYKLIVQK